MEGAGCIASVCWVEGLEAPRGGWGMILRALLLEWKAWNSL